MAKFKTFATIKTDGVNILVKSEKEQKNFLVDIQNLIDGRYGDESIMFTALDDNPLLISKERLSNAVILTTKFTEK